VSEGVREPKSGVMTDASPGPTVEVMPVGQLIAALANVPYLANLGRLPSPGFLDRLFDRPSMEAARSQYDEVRAHLDLAEHMALLAVRESEQLDASEVNLDVVHLAAAKLVSLLQGIEQEVHLLREAISDLKPIRNGAMFDESGIDYVNAQKDQISFKVILTSIENACVRQRLDIEKVVGTERLIRYNVNISSPNTFPTGEERTDGRDWQNDRLRSALQPNLLEIGRVARELARSGETDNIAEHLPAYQDMGVDTYSQVVDLGDIALWSAAIERAKAELAATVERARSKGIPWSPIGAAIGVTQQAAQRRFDESARQKHSDYKRR